MYAWGCSKYYEYMVLELLGELVDAPLLTDEGLTLRNLVVLAWQMVGRCTVPRASYSLRCEQTDALEHVHAHHLVHCDIKPGNFLTTKGLERVYISDFGLCSKGPGPVEDAFGDYGRGTYTHLAPGQLSLPSKFCF